MQGAAAALVVIDLSAVPFLDSSGVAGLVNLNTAAMNAGQTVILRNPSKRVLRTLTITGLSQAWPIETDATKDAISTNTFTG